MEPADSAAYPIPRPLAPDSACYLPWLKVSVLIRYALAFPWSPEAWAEVRQDIGGLLAEQARIRQAGWFNYGF